MQVLAVLSVICCVWGMMGRHCAGEAVPGEEHFPIVYVVYTPGGTPIARAVIKRDDPCPGLAVAPGAPSGTLAQLGNVRTRAVGSSAMPSRFQVKVCEVRLPHELPAESVTFGGRALPGITTAPSNVVVIGDTGLRIKTWNDGTCVRPGPERLYGIKQCSPKETLPFNASLVSGDFQEPSNWPLKVQMEAAAAKSPDLVVHVGDYFYRESFCPQNQECAPFVNDAASPRLPGKWGDNWGGWYADFFEQSLPLLSAAPWIAMRGNHERCGRGGAGYFLFLDPRPYPAGVLGGHHCLDYTDTYSVPFATEQFLVIDTAMIDDFYVDKKCPAANARQAEVLAADRLQDKSQEMSHTEIMEQVKLYAAQFEKVEKLKRSNLRNLLASHHPIFGVVCDKGTYVSMDWTLQQALGPSTLYGISALIHGHVHWFQGLAVDGLPPTLIAGNGGTLLAQGPRAEDQLRGMKLMFNGTRMSITKAFTKSVFGYTRMGINSDGSYTFKAQYVDHKQDYTHAARELEMWSSTTSTRLFSELPSADAEQRRDALLLLRCCLLLLALGCALFVARCWLLATCPCPLTGLDPFAGQAQYVDHKKDYTHTARELEMWGSTTSARLFSELPFADAELRRDAGAVTVPTAVPRYGRRLLV